MSRKDSRPKLHVFPNGQVEVGTGGPGYRWVNAYSAVTENGYSNPRERAEWRGRAKRDGMRVMYHKTEAEAREAMRQEKTANP